MGGARYRANCLAGSREPFKRDTVDLALGATEGADRVFSQKKSDTVFRHSTIKPVSPKKVLLVGAAVPDWTHCELDQPRIGPRVNYTNRKFDSF